MPFLQKIDELFEELRLQYSPSPKSDDFHVYIPIEISDNVHRFQFLIRKGKKSKILILSENQKVYLTDYQIIHAILSMEDKEVDWFLKQFISLYTENGVNVKFVLDKSEFVYIGIPSYPEKKSITLISDTNIDLNCFCFLLNFIFAKDKCWEMIGEIPNFSKRTLCKYISIVDYYHNQTAYSKMFLETLGYPVNLSQPSDCRGAQKAFDKDDYVEKFDISNYI